MVFSSGLGADQYGRAIVVPCKHRAHGIDNLIREAECLWAVEAKTKPGDPRRLSAEWGCVALLVNPNLTKSDQLCTLLDGWNERVSRERCYGQLNSAVCEEVVVDESGHMKIPWPESEDRADLGVDILLATATNPTIVGGHYASPQQVAAAWNSRDGRNYADYFCKNRACGIKTFQDDSIQENLRALWRQKGVPHTYHRGLSCNRRLAEREGIDILQVAGGWIIRRQAFQAHRILKIGLTLPTGRPFRPHPSCPCRLDDLS